MNPTGKGKEAPTWLVALIWIIATILAGFIVAFIAAHAW